MRTYLAVSVAVFAGCLADEVVHHDVPPQATETSVGGPQAFWRAGTRLALRHEIADDGTRRTVGLFDRLQGKPCVLTASAGGIACGGGNGVTFRVGEPVALTTGVSAQPLIGDDGSRWGLVPTYLLASGLRETAHGAELWPRPEGAGVAYRPNAAAPAFSDAACSVPGATTEGWYMDAFASAWYWTERSVAPPAAAYTRTATGCERAPRPTMWFALRRESPPGLSATTVLTGAGRLRSMSTSLVADSLGWFDATLNVACDYAAGRCEPRGPMLQGFYTSDIGHKVRAYADAACTVPGAEVPSDVETFEGQIALVQPASSDRVVAVLGKAAPFYYANAGACTLARNAQGVARQARGYVPVAAGMANLVEAHD